MTVNKRIRRTMAFLAVTSALLVACGGGATADPTSGGSGARTLRDPDNEAAKAFIAPAFRGVASGGRRALLDPDNPAAAPFVLPALRDIATGTVVVNVASSPRVIRDPDNPYWTLR